MGGRVPLVLLRLRAHKILASNPFSNFPALGESPCPSDSEHSGYWESTSFLDEVDRKGETSFFDSVSGDLLFVAPRNRSVADFLAESRSHGWPSFRDEEVNWSFVRVLDDGECVSVSGTHLGHNLPDKKGNRYCINLVSVCANPR